MYDNEKQAEIARRLRRGLRRLTKFYVKQVDETGLAERQEAHAEVLLDIADEFGKFDKTAGPDGAHYFDAENNPFGDEGLACGNCVFFIEGDDDVGACELVDGDIEAGGLCKMWVIPEAAVSAE